MRNNELNQLCINTIRTLTMDAVQQASSGHPGLPMGAATMGYVLWTRFLKHDPADPSWPDRDRFVLSAGHGCMLLYSLLHLTGYDLPLNELKRFRQWGSRTPGHPEYGLTVGVEATAGPLGQGFAMGVGMAIAQSMLAARFNRPGHIIVDHYTYAIVSDGDLMEGITSEAASLAGHLRLGKLIYLYDDNKITIEGSTDLAFSEDVGKRFESYGWDVQSVDGNDILGLEAALRAAQNETERPSLIIAHTHIAYGSPNKQDSASAHGAPLGEEEVRLTKQALGWDPDATFHVPAKALAHFRRALDAGAAARTAWQERFSAYQEAYPELAREWGRIMNHDLPEGWESHLPEFGSAGPLATRAASGKVLNALAKHVPELVGGSADLAPSNKTYLEGHGDYGAEDRGGRNLHFGIREHAMGAILNGMALHGGWIAYGATFLVFCDYMRPAIRLAALMELPVIYVFTHDSIAVGEDGATHEPVEQLATLRATPNLIVIRPADASETLTAWKAALERKDGPVALILARQKVPTIDRSSHAPADGLFRGAYVLVDSSSGRPDLILLATGSEVSLALAARDRLEQEGVGTRVVSMPSWKLFEAEPLEYQEAVLLPEVTARLAIEAGVAQGWWRYVGTKGDVLSVERFGASAPGEVVLKEYGFTVQNVVERALALLKRH